MSVEYNQESVCPLIDGKGSRIKESCRKNSNKNKIRGELRENKREIIGPRT